MNELLTLINACCTGTGQASVDLKNKMLTPCPFCRSSASAKQPHSSLCQFPSGEWGVKIFGANCTCAGQTLNAVSIVGYFFNLTTPKDRIEKLKSICAGCHINPATFGVKDDNFKPEKRHAPDMRIRDKGLNKKKKSEPRGLDRLPDDVKKKVLKDLERTAEKKHLPSRFAVASMFSGGVKDTKNGDEIELGEFLRDVKNGRWRKEIETLRQITDKKARDLYKNNKLPTVAPWGVYTERNEAGLQSLSGFLVVDFDGKDNPGKDPKELRARLGAMPFCLGAFLSPSGHGVKAIVRANPELGKDGNTLLAETLTRHLGWQIDRQGSQWMQASWDPEAVIFPANPLQLKNLRAPDEYSLADAKQIFAGTLERYFYKGNALFHKKDGAQYKPFKMSEVNQDFRAAGIPKELWEAFLIDIRDKRYVHQIYHGLSGHTAGLYRDNEYSTLVESSPTLIEPKRGNWQTIRQALDAMFADPNEPLQLPALLTHLKFAYSNFRDQILNGFNEGHQPYMGIMGGAGTGKSSFMLQMIVTPLLGGRACDAKQALMAEDRFNSEISTSEILQIDDAEPVKYNLREMFSSNIKRYLYSRNLKMEGKGRDSFSLTKFFFFIIQAFNEEKDDCIDAAPQISEDILDKICYYHAAKNTPLPQGDLSLPTNERKHGVAMQIQAELPAFAWHLLNEHRIPAELLPETENDRNGFKCYIHPQCRKRLFETSMEHQFIEAFDYEQSQSATQNYGYEYPALKFFRIIGNDKISSRKAGRILTKLTREMPTRVTRRLRDGKHLYRIWDPRLPAPTEKQQPPPPQPPTTVTPTQEEMPW